MGLLQKKKKSRPIKKLSLWLLASQIINERQVSLSPFVYVSRFR